jgi:hypothetical protein
MRGDEANEDTLGQDNKASRKKPDQKKEILIEVLEIQEQVAHECEGVKELGEDLTLI